MSKIRLMEQSSSNKSKKTKSTSKPIFEDVLLDDKIEEELESKLREAREPFRLHPFYEDFQSEGWDPKCKLERSMLLLSQAIRFAQKNLQRSHFFSFREKENWQTKINDPTIVKKWVDEAKNQPKPNENKGNFYTRQNLYADLTDEAIQFVIEEAKWFATLKDGVIEPSAADGVWQSDALIDDELRDALIKGVKKLEDVPDHKKDWHPGSNNQV